MLWRLFAASLLVCFSLGVFADSPELSQELPQTRPQEPSASPLPAVDNTNAETPKTAESASAENSTVESSHTSSPFAVARADKSSKPIVGGGLVSADPVSVVTGLLVVVVMIVLVAWLMRRLGGLPTMGGASMKVISALSVGTREKIVLVDIAGNQMLLGVAPGRVSCLQSFDQPVVDVKAANNSEFSKTIKKLLKDRSGLMQSSSESNKNA
jgi:flagellar biosynthetic protein FliO